MRASIPLLSGSSVRSVSSQLLDFTRSDGVEIRRRLKVLAVAFRSPAHVARTASIIQSPKSTTFGLIPGSPLRECFPPVLASKLT